MIDYINDFKNGPLPGFAGNIIDKIMDHICKESMKKTIKCIIVDVTKRIHHDDEYLLCVKSMGKISTLILSKRNVNCVDILDKIKIKRAYYIDCDVDEYCIQYVVDVREIFVNVISGLVIGVIHNMGHDFEDAKG